MRNITMTLWCVLWAMVSWWAPFRGITNSPLLTVNHRKLNIYIKFVSWGIRCLVDEPLWSTWRGARVRFQSLFSRCSLTLLTGQSGGLWSQWATRATPLSLVVLSSIPLSVMGTYTPDSFTARWPPTDPFPAGAAFPPCYLNIRAFVLAASFGPFFFWHTRHVNSGIWLAYPPTHFWNMI